MSLGKRLFIGGEAAAAATSETADIFGDSSGIALYTLDYDASDESGNYDGTPTDVTFGVDGQINWGASFNGSSSAINIGGSQFNSLTSITISAWINSDVNDTYSIIANVGKLSTDGKSLSIARSRSTVNGSLSPRELYVNIGSTAYDGDYTLESDIWYNVVVTYSGTSLKIYVNGSLTASHTVASMSFDSSGNGGYIGRGLNLSYPFYWNGKIDQVRIFNKELSSSEVSTLYGETATVYTATTDTVNYQATNLAYYKLDNNALDETGNYDGTENSITYEFGRFGTAAVFDGSSSYIQTTLSPSVAATSHSFWMNPTSSTDSRMPLYFDNRGGRIDVVVGGDANDTPEASYESVIINSSTYNNQWVHIVIVCTGWASSYTSGAYGSAITAKVYINGVLEGTVSPTPYGQTTGMRIGRSGGGYYFQGRIDQVRVFDSELDATAVANLYNEKQAYITKNASDPFGDGDEEAFYKFDNNTNDSTGSYNMTNRNITFSTDSAIGTYSGEFNGTSSEGIISSTTTTPVDFSAENFTISFWAKVDNFTNTVYPVNKWGGSHAERTILTSIRSTGFEDFAVYENNGFGNVQMIHSQTLEANRWYHFAYTRNGSTGTIYIDGVGESFNRTNTINTTNNDIFIGNVSEASTYWFDGYIDSVRLFSRCLDGDEVFKLYAEVIN